MGVSLHWGKMSRAGHGRQTPLVENCLFASARHACPQYELGVIQMSWGIQLWNKIKSCSTVGSSEMKHTHMNYTQNHDKPVESYARDDY